MERSTKVKHGMCGTPTYVTWVGMMQRCTNPNHEAYPEYGGAGIDVCESWRDFQNFLAEMGERPEGKTLERVSNKLGYNKANCEWATPMKQARNRKSNRLITIGGETKCVTEWNEHFKLKHGTFGRLIYNADRIDGFKTGRLK